MKQNRVIAFILAIVMVFNMSISAVGESGTEQSAQKHTVTWYASADNSSLVPLESSRTSMTDNGSTLTAVSDTVDTTIHTVYHENQTLVSVEMAGTGFSFSPIMLNDYYPVLSVDESKDSEEMPKEPTELPEEDITDDNDETSGEADDTLSPEEETDGENNDDHDLLTENDIVGEGASEDGLPAESVDSVQENNEPSEESQDDIPGEEADETEPEQPTETEDQPEEEYTAPEIIESTDTEGAPETSPDDPIPAEDAQEQAEAEGKENTENAEQSFETESTDHDDLPVVDEPEQREETPAADELTTGYAKTLTETYVYRQRNRNDPLGRLPGNSVVWIASLPDESSYAGVVFDTSEMVVEGYILRETLLNLTAEEISTAKTEALRNGDVRRYADHPLVRITAYVPTVPATSVPEATLMPEPTDTPEHDKEKPTSEQPDAPEATETPAPMEAPAEEPDPTPVPEEQGEQTETPVPEDTSAPAKTSESTDTPLPETTPAPTPEETLVTVPDSTPEPVPAEETVSASEPTPVPEPTTAPVEAPMPVEEPVAVPAEPHQAEEIPVSTEAPVSLAAESSVPAEPTVPAETPVPETENETNDSVGTNDITGWLRWLLPSASAEESQSRPSSITGRKIGGALRSTAKSGSSRSGSVSAIVFDGLFDSVTDVRLSATTTGVKEDIIVHQYTANHIYQYQLKTNGLSAGLSGRTVYLYDGAGNALARIDAPYMTDAAGKTSSEIAVSLSGGGGSYTLTYSPNDEWMRSASYPVTIDPTGEYFNDLSTGIGDVYVSSSQPDKHFAHTVASGSAQYNHALEGTNLYAGTYGGNSVAYVCPVLSGLGESWTSDFPVTTPLLIESASWKVNIHEMSGDGKFRISLVTGGWNTSTVTYNTRPSLSPDIYVDVTLHTGWNTVDVTKLFSAWFNARDQKQNYGFAITSSSSWARICSSDVLPRNERMSFSATYYTGVTKPALTIQPKGYGVNSGSGWAELKWNSVSGAQGYLLGVYNGKEYEYRYIGNTTSYSTKDKKLWPTQAEISAGSYALHWDGTGEELPCIPRNDQSDLNYYFSVIPCNQYSQTASDATAAYGNAMLPDTLPPVQPVSVSVSPAGWTNADSVRITWAGVLDLPLKETQMSGGSVQYVLDPEGNDPTAWNWTDTGSSAANGSIEPDISSLANGEHAVYIRGKDANGNYGTPNGAQILIDRIFPVLTDVSITPDDWTKESEAAIIWTGARDELSGLADVSVEIESNDDGSVSTVSYTLTLSENGEESVDISSLTDGEHTVIFRLTDAAGMTLEETDTLYIDRTAPIVEALSVSPDAWTEADTLTVLWSNASDEYSGLAEVSYSLDGENYTTFTDLAVFESGEKTIDITEIKDGKQQLTLRFTDKAGNAGDFPLAYFVDRTAPAAAIDYPLNGDTVSGILNVLGTAEDISLAEWTFTATGESGTTVELTGTDVRNAESLGILDTGLFADGEEITMTLTVHDAVGHETIADGVCVTAVHSAMPVTQQVTITAPETGAILREKTAASYEVLYSEEEKNGKWYVDGGKAFDIVSEADSHAYDIMPILFPEDSSHTLNVISEDENGAYHYSQGFRSVVVFSDTLQNADGLETCADITFTSAGAEAESDSAVFATVDYTPVRPVTAIRLNAVEGPEGTYGYEYSTDQGNTWHAITCTRDAVFTVPQNSIRIRCSMTEGAVLHGLDVTGIYESEAVRFSVRLLKEVNSFSLTTPRQSTNAVVSVTNDCPAEMAEVHLYADDILQDNANSLSLLPYAENSVHTLAQAGVTADGTLYGTGAEAKVILRDTPDSTGTYDSGDITTEDPVYAVRLEVLCTDEDGNEIEYTDLNSGLNPGLNGVFSYSTDGEEWITVTPGEYAFLKEKTNTIHIHAELPEGITLRGIHAEGITLRGKEISPCLVQSPQNVTAKDYGAYSNRRYELSWTDPAPADTSAPCTVYYDIRRSGALIASVTGTSFTDRDYVSGAQYTVSVRRVYADPMDGNTNLLVRESAPVAASVKRIALPATATPAPSPTPAPTQGLPSVRGDVEHHELLHFTDINTQYTGNYTTEAAVHEERFTLDQSLLGPHRFCSLGFEPINFNTGNFFVQARDFTYGGIDLIRTYNSLSDEDNTPFGAKWSSELTQCLTRAENGGIAWRRADGSEVIFTQKPDGSYASNSTEYEQLAATDEGYRITLTDGTVYCFGNTGLLLRRETENGITGFERDAENHLTGILLTNGERITVSADESGHITGLTLPGGARVSYTYEGDDLVSVTDPDGNVTRYEYGKNGLMTAWYDGTGICQARNIYDDQYRVIAQTDANGGSYTLEYHDDHTVTTDAEGNRVAYYRDEKQRTTRIVESDGSETSFTYGVQGEIVSETDALGQITVYAYNANGDKISETDPRGMTVSFVWDDAHHLLRRTDFNGNTTSYTYDANGNLLTETAPDGGVTKYTYDVNGNILTQTDPLGNTVAYTYEKSLLTSETDAMGNTTRYQYDINNHVSAVTDALGNSTEYAYSAKGDLLKITFADGTSVSYTYDALGRQTSMTDPMGNVTRYSYDGLGNMTEVILPDGAKQTASYSASGLMESVTDALGNTERYTYDNHGNMLSLTDAEGNVTTSEYDALNRLVTETNPLGGVTAYTYDPVGLPLSVTDPAGATESYTYDGNGNILTRTLPTGGTISVEYDSMNRPVKQENALGGETVISYDLNGNILSVTDPLGAETVYTYDANNNLLTVTDALGNVTEYTYDALNRVIAETAPNGGVTKYEYDMVGNLIAITDALGSRTEYEYDANANLTVWTDPLGNSAVYAYDSSNRLNGVVYADGSANSLRFDAAGNIIAETDAEGNEKQYLYDRLNRLTGVVDELGNLTGYIYDPLGNLTKVTDALGHETAYTYDESGKLLSETDALGNTIHYEYTQNGLLQKVIKADGQEIEICYNDAGTPVAVFADDGYTLTGGCNEIGPVQLLRNSAGTVTYQYNMAGTLVSVENVNGDVVSYTYDAYGNKASVTYPDGRTVSYTYDLPGRMTSVIGLDGEVTEYTYDANGRRVQTASDTLTTDYTYDKVGNLIRQETSGESDISFAYSYDRNGFITEETRMENGTTVTSSYAYNPMGELISFTQSTGYGESYTYDPAGNMLEKVITGTDGKTMPISMQYNAGNQMVSMTAGKDSIAYRYDANGSMVKKVLNSAKYGTLTDTYTYDALDQLTAYTGYDGYRQEYTYDANGMRATKSEAGNGTRSTLEELLRGDIAGLPAIVAPVQTEDVNADGTIPAEYAWATTEYLYDIAQEYYQVLMETTADANNSTVSTAYTYGLERIASYTDSSKTAHVYDGRGSLVQNIMKNGAQSFLYTAFGEQMGNMKQSGFAYNAEAYDAATGMLNLRARQYEPAMMRFSQQDAHSPSMTLALSLNEYLFTWNSPVNWFDANGLEPDDPFDSNVKADYYKYLNSGATAKERAEKESIDATNYWIDQATKDSAAYNITGLQKDVAMISNIGVTSGTKDDTIVEIVRKAQKQIQKSTQKDKPETNNTSALLTLCDAINSSVTGQSVERGKHVNDAIGEFKAYDPGRQSKYEWVEEQKEILKKIYEQSKSDSNYYTPQFNIALNLYGNMVVKNNPIRNGYFYASTPQSEVDRAAWIIEEFLGNYAGILTMSAEPTTDLYYRMKSWYVQKPEYMNVSWVLKGREMLEEIKKHKGDYPREIQKMIEEIDGRLLNHKTIEDTLFVRDGVDEYLNYIATGYLTELYAMISEYMGMEVDWELKKYIRPKVTNPNLQKLLDGEDTNFLDVFGNNYIVTNDDWIEFYNVLVYLESVGRLKYGYKGHTSHSVEDHVLYIDCWGLAYVMNKASLSERRFSQTFICDVSDMEEAYANDVLHTGLSLEVYNGGAYEDNEYDIQFLLDNIALSTYENAFVFVENDDNNPGSDHIYVIVHNLPDKRTGNVYAVGCLGMGIDGIQTLDAITWLSEYGARRFSIGKQ